VKTGIIDYGMGNLRSVKRAFEVCSAEVEIIQDAKMIKNFDYLVLPGVGAFKDGMNNLEKGGWTDEIINAVVSRQMPLLGICLGMQLLADLGFEGGKTKGLALIRGEIKQLIPDDDEKIPHIGWNEVRIKNKSALFNGINDCVDFYFVHSFHFIPEENANILATTPYCNQFVSAISKENIYGVQFHPEKSQRPGLKLITNFLNL
jgi:glutamine amidotransferase